MANDPFFDPALLKGARAETSFFLPWPAPGNPAGLIEFATADEWRSFVSSLSLPCGIPEIVSAKFRRAQMLYFLAWLYNDLIKAGELMALATLELALNDCYGDKIKKRGAYRSFAELLKYMIADGLTDEKIPMVRRSGGSAIGFVNGDSKPSLADIRNKQAHGDPFDGFPVAGLLELVRDLIAYAYVNPQVVLELGTHAEFVPRADFTIRSFVAEEFPKLMKDGDVHVVALLAKRTFWEKVTILHAEFHRPADKALPDRYSRHYYDVAMMARGPIRAEALADMALLDQVVIHKQTFYPSDWAHYAAAHPGSLRLLPAPERIVALERDYRNMGVMLFGAPPPFAAVMEALKALEEEINTLKVETPSSSA